EKNKNRLNETVYNALESFWGDSSLIEFIDFNERIARQARDLIREAIGQGYALRTNDAIHLASASYVDANEFLTYDKKLEKFSAIIACAIREPYLVSPRLPFIDDDPD